MKRASVVGGKETTEPADVHKAEGYAGNTISMIPWERRIRKEIHSDSSGSAVKMNCS